MHEIKVLSDEEFYEYKKETQRKAFLQELEFMSKSNAKKTSSFTVKDVKNKPTPETEQTSSISQFSQNYDQPNIDDIEWSNFIENVNEYNLSPIERIIDDNITGFQLDDDIDTEENKYGKVFKKELAMLSEVLKDVKAHGTRVNNELKKMTPSGKGTGSRATGIPKGYSDLVEAYNSINTTKLQVIKAMTDLKAKQMDWKFKDKTANPSESESVDNIADAYYKRIIGGGTKNFIQNSSSNYSNSEFDYDPVDDSQPSSMNLSPNDDSSELDSIAMNVGFNITQPIKGSRSYADMNNLTGDEYGYISHEKQRYDICVYQYGEHQYQFAALDEDGEVVEGVELPTDTDPEIVNSLQLRPGSDYVYDRYGRKYRLIDMSSGVDISDIDDMDYPFDD